MRSIQNKSTEGVGVGLGFKSVVSVVDRVSVRARFRFRVGSLEWGKG